MSEAKTEHLLAEHAAFAAARSNADPAWLAQLRAEARGAFADSGLPTTKREEWRYTNIAPVSSTEFSLAPEDHAPIPRAEIEAHCFPVYACSLFVFVDGHFDPELSSQGGLGGDPPVHSLAEVLRDEPLALASQLGQGIDTKQHPFAALNTAFLEDGAVIRVPEGAAIESPIHLVFVTTDSGGERMNHPRVWLHAGENSSVTVIQDHVSLGSPTRLTNAVCEVHLEANARCNMVLLQRESDSTYHFSNTRVHQERDSHFHSHAITLSGALVRNDLEVLLAGSGAECDLYGLTVGVEQELLDNHSVVDHAVPHCESRQLYKTILGESSRGVFRGRVIVRPDAQQTNASQSNRNLLLDDRAEVDTKPQLEIYADDVKCSHGSTIGQLDPEAVFYLRSRGLSPDRARQLLTRGFASAITRTLPTEPLRETVEDLLLARLHLDGGPP